MRQPGTGNLIRDPKPNQGRGFLQQISSFCIGFSPFLLILMNFPFHLNVFGWWSRWLCLHVCTQVHVIYADDKTLLLQVDVHQCRVLQLFTGFTGFICKRGELPEEFIHHLHLKATVIPLLSQ